MVERKSALSAVIAEDDFLVSREVVRAAHAAGLTVLAVAADGEQALDLVKQHNPAVAIMDIQMPRLTGLQAAQRIREEHPTPVVILTAFETPEFLKVATQAGVGAYLTKPPDGAALGRAVEIAVARHADLMELTRLNQKLNQALLDVRTLESLLPICMRCKKIRDDAGAWQTMETYIYEHTGTQFSHGLCPDCFQNEVDLIHRNRL